MQRKEPVKTLTQGLVGTVVLLFAVALQAQSNVVLKIRSASDQAKTISWNSSPGAVYTIESAEALGEGSLAQLPWVTREVEFQSQGTNTLWMDIGDPTWIPRLYHPRAGVSRFYRVIQTGTNALPSPVVSMALFTNSVFVSSNQAVGDFLEVRYSVDTGTNGDIVSETVVFVDGQIVKRGGSDSTNAWINTTEWPNAEHKIWVEAKTISAADTTTDDTNWDSTLSGVGISASQSVSFDNYIFDFFVATPFFIPSIDGPQEIAASFQEESYWRLWVLQGGQTVVAFFEGTNTSLYAAWDGTDFSGTEVWNGYYDYLIEARPTRIGPFPSSVMRSSTIGAPGSAIQPENRSLQVRQGRASVATAASEKTRFQRDPNFQIPASDRNPMSIGPSRNTPDTALKIAESKPSPLMVMPEDGSSVPLPLWLYPPGFDLEKMIIFDPFTGIGPQIMEAANESEKTDASLDGSTPQPQRWGGVVTDTQTTSTPIRTPGEIFKGFAGVFGTGYQGHHVSWKDVGPFPLPTGAHGFTAHLPPWGPLRNAGVICNKFSTQMTSSGWRRAFQLADENFRWPDLKGCATGDCVSEYGVETAFGGRFRNGCDFGLLVGHMAAADSTPLGASHAYYPFWNPTLASSRGGTWRSYSWIGVPEMDFGQSATILGGPSFLKWMGLYGCNSLRIADVNDMWTKFLLPMPPNVHVLLGSGGTVYISPDFGNALADNMNGRSTISQGNPMTVIESWFDAGTKACAQANTTRNPLKRPGQTTLTAVFRNNSIFGDPGTEADTIWNYSGSINQDWTDIDWDSRSVWP